MSISRTKMLQVSKCLIGLAVMILQSCETVDNRRDLLCGNWDIKISRFIVTFAYEEFFEGYATRRGIMQQITN